MGIHGYELGADGSDWDETAFNEFAVQLGRVLNVGFYPFRVQTQDPIDLSSVTASTVYLLHPVRAMTLYKFIVLYTEAAGAASCTLKLGKETDDDYYYTGSSSQSNAQYDEDDLTLLKTDVAAGDTVIFQSANNSGVAGEIIIILVYGVTPS